MLRGYVLRLVTVGFSRLTQVIWVIVKGRSPSFRQSFYKRSLRGYSRTFYEMSRRLLIILLLRFVTKEQF